MNSQLNYYIVQSQNWKNTTDTNTQQNMQVVILTNTFLFIYFNFKSFEFLFAGPLVCRCRLCSSFVFFLSPVGNGFLRFTSGATTADLLMASTAGRNFLIYILF